MNRVKEIFPEKVTLKVNLERKLREGRWEKLPGRRSRKQKGREVTVSHNGFTSKGNVLLNTRFSYDLCLGLRSLPWWI